jgi:hypothetical protein
MMIRSAAHEQGVDNNNPKVLKLRGFQVKMSAKTKHVFLILTQGYRGVNSWEWEIPASMQLVVRMSRTEMRWGVTKGMGNRRKGCIERNFL